MIERVGSKLPTLLEKTDSAVARKERSVFRDAFPGLHFFRETAVADEESAK
jgi:hypothetical protein